MSSPYGQEGQEDRLLVLKSLIAILAFALVLQVLALVMSIVLIVRHVTLQAINPILPIICLHTGVFVLTNRISKATDEARHMATSEFFRIFAVVGCMTSVTILAIAQLLFGG